MTGAELKNAFVPADTKKSPAKSARQIGIISGSHSVNSKDPPRPKMPNGEDVSYLDMLKLHREAIEKTDAQAPTPASAQSESTPSVQSENAESAPNPKPEENPESNTTPPAVSPTENTEKTEDYGGDIPEYIILGEAYNCYVIVQLEDRLLMIDKHAAHERILFDELCRRMKKAERNGQILLAPYELTVSNAEADALSEYGDKIRSLGFEYTVKAQSAAVQTVSVTQIPSELSREEASVLFSTLISRLSDVTASVESAAAEFFESRLWQASCKAAMKGGRIYDIAHIKWICDRLLVSPHEGGAVIRTCPHGRPVAFEIKKSSIERQFERS